MQKFQNEPDATVEKLKEKQLEGSKPKYMSESNQYNIFLKGKTEQPRLSILDNYKQIMRIMTASYIRSADEEKKFRDRKHNNEDDKNLDFDDDPEYASYKEEKQNTQKMSRVLKSIQENGIPKKRRMMSATSLGPRSTQASHRTT